MLGLQDQQDGVPGLLVGVIGVEEDILLFLSP
jgi:hypothetical protein